jgi:predicted heme/steroid binding protein/uncharacterized membrane protein
MEPAVKAFSADELAKHDGQDGQPVYVAHAGRVYDVSGSTMWKTGMHMKRHQAGTDLTDDIKAAPHDTTVFERFPQVGTLQPGKAPMDEGIPDLLLALFRKVPMLRRHPHPMTVHFPIAFMMLAPVLNLLYLATGNARLEASAFHVLAAGLIVTPVAMLTGPYNWWLNYGGRWTGAIVVKMVGSLMLMVLILVGFLWRILSPGIMLEPGQDRLLYLVVILLLPAIVSVLGWFGAKMTFPH